MREEEKDIGLETDAKNSVREGSRECQTEHSVLEQKVWVETTSCSEASVRLPAVFSGQRHSCHLVSQPPETPSVATDCLEPLLQQVAFTWWTSRENSVYWL